MRQKVICATETKASHLRKVLKKAEGDALFPLLFWLLIQAIIANIQQNMNEWYLNDGSQSIL